MKSALVIGAGNFGGTLAAELTSKNCEVTVIDVDHDRIQEIKDVVTAAVEADGTQKDVLQRFAVDVDIAVVSLGDKIDTSILATHFLKELGVKKIIAKAASVDHAKVLRIVGAAQVVLPEMDQARRLAASLVQPDILDYIKLSDEFNMVELAVPDDFIKKSIQDLDLRRKFGLQILAIKNPLTDDVRILPPADYAFRPDDVMIVIGDVQSLDKLRKLA